MSSKRNWRRLSKAPEDGIDCDYTVVFANGTEIRGDYNTVVGDGCHIFGNCNRVYVTGW